MIYKKYPANKKIYSEGNKKQTRKYLENNSRVTKKYP